jgi:hypothetical protein
LNPAIFELLTDTRRCVQLKSLVSIRVSVSNLTLLYVTIKSRSYLRPM